MSKASDLLRRAAQAVDECVLPERDLHKIELATLHILGMCGADTSLEATELLIKMFDEL